MIEGNCDKCDKPATIEINTKNTNEQYCEAHWLEMIFGYANR